MSASTPSDTTTSHIATSAQTVLLTAEDIERTLKRLAHELIEANHGTEDLVLLGIITRGQYLAERLGRLLQTFDGKPVPVGTLDITLYRDDSRTSFKPTGSSHLPVDITSKKVILVDDVLFSGRTVRAALDALSGYGRPQSVQLMVLLDRGHRELPIAANFVGKNIPTARVERVNVQLTEIDGQDQVTLSK